MALVPGSYTHSFIVSLHRDTHLSGHGLRQPCLIVLASIKIDVSYFHAFFQMKLFLHPAFI